MRTFRVRVEQCLLKPNIPAGMDLGVVGGLVPMLRKTAEDPEPILVEGFGAHYRIVDGRHRFFAAVIAGRSDVLAITEDDG